MAVSDEFSGRTAVITGGTGVLGAEMARAVARCGADVVLVGRNVWRAEQVMATFAKSSGKYLALAADVLDRPALEEVCGRVLGERGKIDFLINAAGGNDPAPYRWVGTAELSDDPASVEQLWREPWRVWVPGGKREPSLRILRVTRRWAE